MNREPIRCIDRNFYTSRIPDSSFEESRAILLGKYEEKELDAGLMKLIQEHLDRCDCCTQFLAGLESIADSVIIDASCPSSAAIDALLFDRSRLTEKEASRIENHLEACELCREEVAWLKNIDSRKALDFAPPHRNWTQILSIAAAIFFAVISTVLIVQIASIQVTEAKLRALAVVKKPNEIDFAALQKSSVPLPEDINRIYEAGVNAIKEGQFEEAAHDMEQVTAVRPDHSGAIYLLGYSYYHLRELEKAFELCDRAEQMRPHDLERCLSLVNIALKTGHYGRAIREISGLHHSAPDQPEVKALYNQITSITRGKDIKL
jgi:hypothetical protein